MRVLTFEIASALVVLAGVAALVSIAIDARRYPYVWVKLLLVGAVSFWIPNVIVHFVARQTFSSKHAAILTFLLPVSFGCAYCLAVWRFRAYPVPIVMPMLLGMWALGGLFTTLGTSFCGGGLSYLGSSEAWRDVLLGLLPPYTFIMAAYDGSLAALLFASLGVLLASYGLERQRRLE